MAPKARCHPERTLRIALEEGRRRGLPFDAAWALAWEEMRRGCGWPTDSVLRREWKEALTDTRDEWRAAYERTPPTPTARAVAALLTHLPMEDREPSRERRAAFVA